MRELDCWQRVVLWGGLDTQDSSRHIYRHFNSALTRLGKSVYWVPDDPASREVLRPGSLVFAYNIWGAHLGAAVEGVDYLLHNFDISHPVFEELDTRHLVRLQVYTNEAVGERILDSPVRLYEPENHVLHQPWGTDLFAEDFHPPFYNPEGDVAFVGAIWNTDGQGNPGAIEELKEAAAAYGLKFIHYTQISDVENVTVVRAARLAPAIAGPWQVEHNYLPCRLFKNVSYGAFGLTNVPKFFDIVPHAFLPGASTIELLQYGLGLEGDAYHHRVLEQQRSVKCYTYRESLLSIAEAFERARG